MASPAATFTTYEGIGQREDLTDVIYNISPTETPFITMAARTTAKARYHEWQKDSLATASAANAQIEGDDSTATTATPTVRLGDYTQILKKTIRVSGTMEAVDKAGRDSEVAYQLAKSGKEIKRDLESCVTQNKGSTVSTTAGGRTLASVESWLFTNRTDIGSNGAPTTPGFISGTVAAPTDNSVAGTFVEANLKAIIGECWTQGGEPRIVMVNKFNKQRASTFAGIATQYNDVTGRTPGTIMGAADVYVSDFGTLRIVPNRFMRTSVVLVLDMDYWALAYLRGMTKEKLAKTGDSEAWHLLTEVTLESRNEKASGKITTTTTS